MNGYRLYHFKNKIEKRVLQLLEKKIKYAIYSQIAILNSYITFSVLATF